MRPSALGALLVLALLAGVLVAAVPALRAQAALTLTRRPTPYTALAFADADPTLVCKQTRSGTVRFTLDNEEPTAHAHAWTVTVARPSGQDLVATGSVTVAAGERATVVAKVRGQVRSATAVTVTLGDRPQHLSLTCPSGSES